MFFFLNKEVKRDGDKVKVFLCVLEKEIYVNFHDDDCLVVTIFQRC
jgi:hypothetical protein